MRQRTVASRKSGGAHATSTPLTSYLTTLRRPLATLPKQLALQPIPAFMGERVVHVTPPGSKSLTNRALLLAALAKGTSTLRNALVDADDAKVMLRAIQQLGAKVERDGTTLRIRGVAGRWKPASRREVRLNLHNAGTATRFLAASALVSPIPIIIDGDSRMRERPIDELANALKALGAAITYLAEPGFPPLRIAPPPPTRSPRSSPRITLSATQSSQFISALLLIAPHLPGGVTLTLERITSESYVDMTLALLRQLGVRINSPRKRGAPGRHIAIEHQPRPASTLRIEADASGACPFLAAAALVPNLRVKVLGISAPSVQPDAVFLGIPERMGAMNDYENFNYALVGDQPLEPIHMTLESTPDTAMTAAVLCAFASPTKENRTATSILTGLKTLRVKETDRVAAIATELRKLGVKVTIGLPTDPDALTITPPKGGVDCSPRAKRVVFETYNDHRMAMSLALVGLRRPNVVIDNPACVAKTYPTFWHDFARLYT